MATASEHICKLLNLVVGNVTVAQNGLKITLHCNNEKEADELFEMLGEGVCDMANQIGWEPNIDPKKVILKRTSN